jgi:ATP-dependent HslUV protease ATP-binding subunit HslU
MKSTSLTPSEIVKSLDKYIVGQNNAKRAVAVALRNRWRRQQVEGELRDEISPKNIIMIGPTGVGKTEIARRLAKLAHAPFVKVEASKFTEVGYVGRDVDSIIRDLMEVSIKLVKDEEIAKLRPRGLVAAEERLLDLLLPARARSFSDKPPGGKVPTESEVGDESTTREKLRGLLHKGKLDEREVEVEIKEDSKGFMQIFGGSGVEEMGLGGLKDMLGNMGGGKVKHRKMKIPDALEILCDQEVERLIDNDAIQREGIKRAEQGGIVFLDEIDKIAVSHDRRGADVSREGVQRDLLPIVEGSTVTTKYGPVRTDHVLFVAAGAFHVSKPSDLIPELQGRFPIRVELEALTSEDFVRILTEPKNALVSQYQALLATEEVIITFDAPAIETLASLAAQVNEGTQNIGARRLHTIMERLLDDLLFSAPDIGSQTIAITADYVKERLADLVEDEELSRYIL